MSCDHVRVIVVGRLGDGVMAVAAHVERDDVVVAQKPAPESDIAVDRETVAVADEEPDRGVRVAVPARTQYRAVGALDRYFCQKLRQARGHPWLHQPRPG